MESLKCFPYTYVLIEKALNAMRAESEVTP